MDYQQIFQNHKEKLNEAQLAAINQINGPVIVVAGPGTGKTELLSLRVANILTKTDASPQNILCLTYTESGASNMKKRLASIIGPEAYKVTIETFHGFGSNVINRYSQYFQPRAELKPVSELAQAEIIVKILYNLPDDNPLSSVDQDDNPIYLKSIKKAIDSFKGSGLSSAQLRTILCHNIDFCDQSEHLINDVFNIPRINKKTIDSARSIIPSLRLITEQQADLDFTIEPKLGQIIVAQFTKAIEEAELADKTTPLTSFRNHWCTKSDDKYIWKQRKYSEQLLLALDIYDKYQGEMDWQGLYDFSDMIINVIKAIRQNPDLKAELIEQYQYILVDEFQDTNDAQMALINELTDFDDEPNLMVVGDDDQAIYRFQGADISNIQTFTKRFNKLKQFDLNINYRSSQDILNIGEYVASGIEQRLVDKNGSTKKIIASKKNPTGGYIKRIIADELEQEYYFVAKEIKNLINSGAEQPNQIAVIARQHAHLELMAKYLAELNIGIQYNHQRNILESELTNLIIDIANIIKGINTGNSRLINLGTSRVISHPAFNFASQDFYEISLKANRQYSGDWLKATAEHSSRGKELANWLLDLGKQANIDNFSTMMELIMGIDNQSYKEPKKEEFTSPIYKYYFTKNNFDHDRQKFLNFLADYNTLTENLKEFLPNKNLTITDLIDFVDSAKTLNNSLFSSVSYGSNDNVHLMTAHSAKGLEFNTVFIIDAENNVWGSEKRAGSNKLSFPVNMPFANADDGDNDEKRRLLYVAITRAKQNLIISSHQKRPPKDKMLAPVEYLVGAIKKENEQIPQLTTEEIATAMSISLIKSRQPRHLPDNLADMLGEKLDNYKLSATDLNIFTTISDNSGPQQLLMQRLIREPEPMVPAAVFGTIMHSIMEKLHNYANSEEHLGLIPPARNTLKLFHQYFDASEINTPRYKRYREKGQKSIEAIYQYIPDHFRKGQRSEIKLDATIDNAIKLNGKIDVAEFDKANKKITIFDYKTGKSFDNFREVGPQKEKIHKYKTQLMFYKILIENSAEFSGWEVSSGNLIFVEPNNEGIQLVQYSFDPQEVARVKQLISAVWKHIKTLNFPDISNYPPNLSGTIKFEDYLIEKDNNLI